MPVIQTDQEAHLTITLIVPGMRFTFLSGANRIKSVGSINPDLGPSYGV